MNFTEVQDGEGNTILRVHDVVKVDRKDSLTPGLELVITEIFNWAWVKESDASFMVYGFDKDGKKQGPYPIHILHKLEVRKVKINKNVFEPIELPPLVW